MAWALSPDRLVVWHDAPLDELLDKQSRPVRLPLTQDSQAMPRFSSLSVESVACEVAASPAEPPSSHTFNVDSVMYTGGPVWALGWCPLHCAEDAAAGPVNTVETLAVSTHPRTQRRNPIGMQHTGPGAVQLWAVPSSVDAQLVLGGLPTLLALLWHQGRLAWDLQWCPNPAAFIATSSNTAGRGSSSSSSCSSSSDAGAEAAAVPLQGLLAAVLGSGDVVVWAVPTIAYLQDLAREAAGQHTAENGTVPSTAAAAAAAAAADEQADGQQASQEQRLACEEHGQQALSLQLQPLLQLPCSAVGGSLASCCCWLPCAPHDQLLVGCWDGNVAIWQLPTTAGGSAHPIQLLRADPTPIHAVAWQPNKRWWLTGNLTEDEALELIKGSSSGGGSTTAAGSCRYFLTASNVGNLKVWDMQDVMQPVHERTISRNAINSAVWLGPPHVFVTASADGQLRTIWLDAGVQATTMTTQVFDVSGSCGSIWSMSGSEVLSVVGYVSDGGLLGLLPMEPPTGEGRHRKHHAAVSAVAVDEDQLWLLSAREIPGNGGLYVNPNLTAGPGAKEGGRSKKGKSAEAATPTVVLDPLPHPDQVLYTVDFSPNYRGVVSLAYGGGAGVVRVHTLSAEVVPVGL